MSLSEYVQNLLPSAIWQTLYMTLVPTFLATLIGFMMAIVLVVTKDDGIKPNRNVNQFLGFIVNVVRSFPFMILIFAMIPITRAIVGTSIGETAAIVPITVGSAPFLARLIESALDDVDKGLIEAAKSFGATNMQIIFKVMIKEAVPSIITSVTIAIITILGYSAMAGAVGAGGLGNVALLYGYQQFDNNVMIYTVVILVLIVQVIQGIGDYLYKKLK